MNISNKINKVVKYSITIICIMATIICKSTMVNAANSVSQDLAIEKVNVLDIMTGTDLGFEEDGNLTRAQAAAIMVRLKEFSENDITYQKESGKSSFKDVDNKHWAMGYINIASLYNLVSGTGDGNFEPNSKVKINEFCAMTSRVLGAGAMINLEGTWPTNYENFATREGMVEGITSPLGNYATRLDAATIIANALELNTWKSSTVSTTGKSSYEREYGKTLRDEFNVVRYTNEVIDEINNSSREVKFKNYKDDVKSDVPDYNLNKSIDLSKLKVDMNVEVWVNKKLEKIIMIKEAEKKDKKTNDTVSFSSLKKFVKESNKFTLVVDGTSYVYYMADSIVKNESRGTYNGKKKSLEELYELLDEHVTKETLTELVGSVKIVNSKIVWIDLGTYENIGVVSEVDESKIYFYDESDVEGTTAASSIKATKENSYVTNLDGKEISFDGIAEGYILRYYYDSTAEKFYIRAYTKNVTGKVTKSKSTYIYVDDKKYPINSSVSLDSVDEDDEIKIYLNSAEEILMYTTDKDIIWLVEADEIDYVDDDGDDDVKITAPTDENCSFGVITYAEGLTANRKKVLKLGITSINGKEIIKYVNLDKMLTLFPSKFDDKSILQEEIIKEYIGTWVKYRVESSKYILYQFGNYVYDGLTKDVVTVENGRLNKDSLKFGTYYFNDSAKFYLTSTYAETDLKRTASFEEVSLEQLSDGSKYDFSGSGISKSKMAYVLVKASNSSLEEVEGSGIVISFSENSKQLTINIATSLGTRTYKASTSTISESELHVGDFIQYSILGNVISTCRITRPDIDNTTANRKIIRAKVINIYEDAINLRLEDESREFYYARNVAYAKGTVKGSTGILTMKSLSGTSTKPGTISSTEKYSNSSGNIVYCYMVKEDGEYKIKAIIY